MESQLGVQVRSTHALRGGLSSAVHLLEVGTRAGKRERVVLRRYVRPELNVEEPDLPGREAQALRVVAKLPLPTPRLLGLEPTGAAAGVPALLMSWLPGRLVWHPRDLEAWLQRLAEPLPAIHAGRVPRGLALSSYAPYPPLTFAPPAWARQPQVWRQAAELFQGEPPALPAVLIHRDFHPGNVLWLRGRISGLVDWQAACLGPAVVDIGHCRANLLAVGSGAASRFTACWEQLSGERFHPWADVVAIVGLLDGLREGRPDDAAAIEEALARAVAELRG
ncbi:MAG: phosphotransferase family protein [Candidatus Dormibacteria bacterium]